MSELRRREKGGRRDEPPHTKPASHVLRSSRHSKMTLLLFAALWLLVLHYFERVRVRQSLAACGWLQWESWAGSPHRVVLVADPQIVDDHTYPHLPRAVAWMLRKMSDNYLHTNYRNMQEHLDPDSVVFVGDLFDGGREWDNPMWLDEYERFNQLFPEKQDRVLFRGLPGNHDIGFQNISLAVRRRFAAHFGTSNDYYVLGNHTFVQLDTISLMHEDEAVSAEPRAFLDSIESALDPLLPRILLSHVPLYRDPRVEVCGAGRESKKPFPLMRGHQYQTVIDYEVSVECLSKIRPTIVFSGDDHDFCDMLHVDYSDNSRVLAREISCKTASMTNGIRFPAYQLLSLYNPGPSATKTYETQMCYLPRPYLGVSVYFALLLASYSCIFLSAYKPHLVRRVSPGAGKGLAHCLAQCGVLTAAVVFVWLRYNQM